MTPRVRELLKREQHRRFGLRTHDVYGNEYWAELSGNAEDPSFGSVRVLKTGPFERVRRIYATMVPVPNAKPLGAGTGEPVGAG